MSGRRQRVVLNGNVLSRVPQGSNFVGLILFLVVINDPDGSCERVADKIR